MTPLLSSIFLDTESLLEYEGCGASSHIIDYSRIYNRLIALIRVSDPYKIDSFYEGMGELGLSKYGSLSDLLSLFPRDWGVEGLCRRGEYIYVKEQMFEEWTTLILTVSPLWLIAGYVVDTIDTEALGTKLGSHSACLNQFRYTSLLVPYIPNLEFLIDKEGGLNDLHIHLNGSTEIDVLWNHMLRNRHAIVSDYEKQFKKYASVRKLSEQIVSDFSPEKLNGRLNDARRLRKQMESIVEYYFHYDGEFTYSMEGELFLYIMIIKLLRLKHDEHLASIFHHYLLIKGLIQRFVVMQQTQVGFSQFQLISGNSFRWDAEKFYRNRFLQLAGPWNKCLINRIEGRFAPQLSVAENRRIVKRIIDGFSAAVKESPECLGDTKLILIAHFIKKPETQKDKTYEIRHYFLRKELKRKSLALVKMIKRNSDGLGAYIKGIDAAASEFDAGPEVFAPSFRFLREAGIEHFTYHVGEDFRHILSGLRTIFEAIEFLDLNAGDRLGHCTALGIEPIIWKKRVGKDLYLRRGEWLDDIVFVWFLIKKYLIKELQPLILSLESEIQSLSKQIYEKSFLPYELVNAWKLRKYSVIPELNTFWPKGTLGYYDSKKEIDNIDCEILHLYNDRLRYKNVDGRLEQYGCRKNYDETIKVCVDALFDVDALRVIQIQMLEILAKRNIVIEALPTSNLHISLYDKLEEYHLKRWIENEHNECVMPSVVLGSDDPGIFMTNIYNEYAIAYLHLGLNNCSISKRMEYIRYLKEYSEIYGFHHG